MFGVKSVRDYRRANSAVARAIGGAICAALLSAVVGCGSSENAAWLPVFPASGTVSVDGRPPAGAFVVLHPKAGYQRAPDGELVRPHGIVREDGTFELTSYKTGDGAPVGEYVVTFELRKVVTYPSGDAGPGPNLIPSKYAKPNTSPVTVKIEAASNSLPPIVLSAARPEKRPAVARNSTQSVRGL
jgi:hypothetical protein